jgi:ferredoxin
VELVAVSADNSEMEIRIRRGRCCGSAQCVEALPLVFAVDAAGKAVVLDPDAASFDELLDAMAACPCQAIELEDDDGARFP